MGTLTKQQLAEGIMMNTLADLLEAKEEGRDTNQLAYFAALFSYALHEAFSAGGDWYTLRDRVVAGCQQFEADDALPMACFRLVSPSDGASSEEYANSTMQSVIDGQI
ncbi:MAG: hypothetical protein ACE5K1_07680 [Acidiferrobacterales bacterium]